MAQPKHVRTLKAKRSARILPYLVQIIDRDTASASEVGLHPVDALSLVKEGLLKPVDKVKTGRRGRPALVYRVTDKGRKRVKRAQS